MSTRELPVLRRRESHESGDQSKPENNCCRNVHVADVINSAVDGGQSLIPKNISAGEGL